MDRNKQIPGTRGPKAKITQQPPDLFIALGAKQSSPRDDPKRPVPIPKTTVSSHLQSSSSSKVTTSTKLKREGSSTSLPVPSSKKMKVNMPVRSGLPGPSSAASLLPVERLNPPQPTNIEPWEAFAVECEITDLFENVINNMQTGNVEKAVGYILGVIKSLKTQRSKLCKIVYSSLFLISRCKPSIYQNEHVINAILSVLRRDVAAGLKGANKSNTYVHMLFINLLTHSFADVPNWPESFVKVNVKK